VAARVRAEYLGGMETLGTAAFLAGVVAYSVAATLYFVDLARTDGSTAAAAWAPRMLFLGVVLHAVQIVTASFVLHVCPVMSLPFALSLGALVIAVAFLSLRSKRGLGALGVIVAPLALMLLVGSRFVGTNEVSPELPTALIASHVAANLLGFALFALAGAAGALYLVQERRLKAKRRVLSGGKLPALDLLDLTEHRLLLAGFPLLTFGVVTGVVFLRGFEQAGADNILRMTLAFVSWSLMAWVLVMRAAAGWRGRRLAYGTLLGLGCVLAVLAGYVVRAGGAPGL
jgi:ABC-type uncharacterized transport system permease subunit